MTQVNVLDTDVSLSRLVELLETQKENEILLARDGKPVAQITLIRPKGPRIGVAKGKFTVPDDFGEWDREIEEMFDKMVEEKL